MGSAGPGVEGGESAVGPVAWGLCARSREPLPAQRACTAPPSTAARPGPTVRSSSGKGVGLQGVQGEEMQLPLGKALRSQDDTHPSHGAGGHRLAPPRPWRDAWERPASPVSGVQGQQRTPRRVPSGFLQGVQSPGWGSDDPPTVTVTGNRARPGGTGSLTGGAPPRACAFVQPSPHCCSSQTSTCTVRVCSAMSFPPLRLQRRTSAGAFPRGQERTTVQWKESQPILLC